MQSGLLAFAAASAFLGAVLYINIVEQPARLGLGPRAMVREWTPSNRRGFIMLAALAIISAILAYVDYWGTGDVRWIIGGGRHPGEFALCLFRDGAGEHLVVRDAAGRARLDNSRAHAELGLARMGAGGNRACRMLHICLGPGCSLGELEPPRLSRRGVHEFRSRVVASRSTERSGRTATL